VDALRGKRTAEDDAGGFRKRLDVVTEEQANELDDGRLARARTAGEDDATWRVTVLTVAGFIVARYYVDGARSRGFSSRDSSARFPRLCPRGDAQQLLPLHHVVSEPDEGLPKPWWEAVERILASTASPDESDAVVVSVRHSSMNAQVMIGVGPGAGLQPRTRCRAVSRSRTWNPSVRTGRRGKRSPTATVWSAGTMRSALGRRPLSMKS
jgi:hypothetical protein